MIRLLVNGLAATAGGGLTYLRNAIPQFVNRRDVEVFVVTNQSARKLLNAADNVTIVEIPDTENVARRFLLEQRKLPQLIQSFGANLLISAGNFALYHSPVPQILLSRNSLYTSQDFFRNIKERGDYRLWLDTRVKGWFARQSIGWADCTVAPSEAFAQELRDWTGRTGIHCVHHGFDSTAFFSDETPLPAPVQNALLAASEALRLLFVSHYNYYRNFEMLFQSIPLLKKKLRRPVKLFLSCKLSANQNPGSYRAEEAASLIEKLEIQSDVVQLGAISYSQLHHLYRACNVYVTPAYAESFAHPLVEAMSCGLPVVASDLAVHREICGDAAIYFPRFSPHALAENLAQIAESEDLSQRLHDKGLQRAKDFSWEKHVDQLLSLARELLSSV